jgi:carbonic anhydrase
MAMSVIHARMSGAQDEEALIYAATREHVLATAAMLPSRSVVIALALAQGKLHIGAAMYSLESGKVEMLRAQ